MTPARPDPRTARGRRSVLPTGPGAAPTDLSGVRLYPPPPGARDTRRSALEDDLRDAAAGFDADDLAEQDSGDGPVQAVPGSGRPATRRIALVLFVQLICIVTLTLLGQQDKAVLAAAAVFPAVLALSVVTVGSRTFGGWFAVWLSWRRRRRRASHINDEGDPINPLWLLDRGLSIGTIRGFRRTEVGVLQLGKAWIAAAWVTDGPRAATPGAADGLTTLLDFPEAVTPGTTAYAVLQQATTDLGNGPRTLLTAWLALRVEPLTALPPAEAMSAVPALIRAELRRLLRHSSDGVLKLVPLDRSDLLSALAATTEVPLTPSATAIETVSESWQLWHARGRFHHAFEVHPGTRRPLGMLVALAMDMAGDDPDAVLTVCIPYPPVPRRGRRPLPTLRLSHSDPVRLTNLADEIMDALDTEGAATHPMSGQHGPALLDTSIVAGSGRG
ncbi:MAG TPA: hypothetical protein VFP72_14070 [Kineosporiaceae bacterium]|nr:hypothetical protein [Kineosporiaceae bacterium]